MNPLALIVAGGTGGHLYPGIAVARAMRERPVAFVVRRGDLGKGILAREGFTVFELSGQGLPRSFSLRGILFPFKLLAGFFEAWDLLRREKPAVVLGMGGYLSFPVLVAARMMGIKTVIHEQNVLPGLSNRILGRWVDAVAVSFAESQRHFKNKNVKVTGLPVRAEIGAASVPESRQAFGLEKNLTTFLIFGGSQGAHRLNMILVETWKILARQKSVFQILHITGARDHAEIEKLYHDIPRKSVVLAYCHDMAAAYAAADLVICRAGAATVAELLAARRPAIFVPFPHASDDHQFYNAQVMQKSGLAEIIPEKELSPVGLASRLSTYLNDPARLQHLKEAFEKDSSARMHRDASQHLAQWAAPV